MLDIDAFPLYRPATQGNSDARTVCLEIVKPNKHYQKLVREPNETYGTYLQPLDFARMLCVDGGHGWDETGWPHYVCSGIDPTEQQKVKFRESLPIWNLWEITRS